MIKLLIKHKVAETATNIFFRQIDNNFNIKLNKVKGSDLSAMHVGMRILAGSDDGLQWTYLPNNCFIARCYHGRIGYNFNYYIKCYNPFGGFMIHNTSLFLIGL